MTAYIETLNSGEILVEVQTRKNKKITSDFHRFQTKREFQAWKKEQKNMTFIK